MTVKEKESVERVGPNRSWDYGPYVRVDERELWNDFYTTFRWELEQAGDYERGAQLTEEQIDVLAWNLAYEAIWTLRDPPEAPVG